MEKDLDHIGITGKTVNASTATRSANITGNRERIIKYDPYIKATKKQVITKSFWFALFLAATIGLILIGYTWWSLLPGTLCLINLFLLIATARLKPETAFESGMLIPAVVVGISPIRLVALANVGMKEKTLWGLKTFTVGELPGHEIKPGEKVPCSAMFGGAMPFARIWTQMEPHPLSWAIEDNAVIERAAETIDMREWEILKKLASEISDRGNIEDKNGGLFYYDDELTEYVNQNGMIPAYLLKNISWGIYGEKYENYEQFIEAVKEYNKDLGEQWDPNEIVINENRIRITFSYWDEEKDDEVEMLEDLKADNDKNFTAGEILFKIHNTSVEYLEDDDKYFFEGLSIYRGKNLSGIPLYFMGQGS